MKHTSRSCKQTEWLLLAAVTSSLVMHSQHADVVNHKLIRCSMPVHTVVSSEDNLVEDMVKCVVLLLVVSVCNLTSGTDASCTAMPKYKMLSGHISKHAHPVHKQEHINKSIVLASHALATTTCMVMVMYRICVATICRWLTQLSDQTGMVQQHLVQDILAECLI